MEINQNELNSMATLSEMMFYHGDCYWDFSEKIQTRVVEDTLSGKKTEISNSARYPWKF